MATIIQYHAFALLKTKNELLYIWSDMLFWINFLTQIRKSKMGRDFLETMYVPIF